MRSFNILGGRKSFSTRTYKVLSMDLPTNLKSFIILRAFANQLYYVSYYY